MSDDSALVLAGDCTVLFRDGTDERRTRGSVVALVKPDDTVLVHDADGYRPAAWLTRAESARVTSDEDGFILTATKGDQQLELVSHTQYGLTRYPVSPTGDEVGVCPDGGTLIRTRTSVTCLDCEADHGIPRRATVLEETCACGLPRMRVERGATFKCCIDRSCESLDANIKARFDDEWGCPNCDGDLRILRRGGLIAGCENYPDCDTGFALPDGLVVGDCECGLPRFATPSGERCLDGTCERRRPPSQ